MFQNPEHYTSKQTENSLVFKQFKPFVSIDNLNLTTAFPFVSFLNELFDVTHDLWKPGLCHESVRLAKEARGIVPKYFPVSTEVMVRICGNEHMWMVVQTPDKMDLITDPAGIIDKTAHRILPYFGRIAHCSLAGFPRLYARQIYSNGEELTQAQEENLLKFMGSFENKIRW